MERTASRTVVHSVQSSHTRTHTRQTDSKFFKLKAERLPSLDAGWGRTRQCWELLRTRMHTLLVCIHPIVVDCCCSGFQIPSANQGETLAVQFWPTLCADLGDIQSCDRSDTAAQDPPHPSPNSFTRPGRVS